MPTRLSSIVRALIAALLLLIAGQSAAAAQSTGAAALGAAIDGLDVSARVLVIGAHPDDEDTRLITFLARGKHVRTAYLSLTRGDGGQNLIGNELGEALGVIRAEELLAARRLDEGVQYFTRAYDFGFSKSADETFQHWPRDTLLGDVVRVVRAFKPHVIVGLFSGTPRDGHGHHQVSGVLAREAYEAASDTQRFSRAAFGAPWTVGKFYRSTRSRVEDATHAFNAGAYDPLIGRSYAEIAAESRSQHKSQAFGQIEPKGVAYAGVRREAARIGPDSAGAEQGLFAGMDTSLARLRDSLPCGPGKAAIDSVRVAAAEARRVFDAFDPTGVRVPLGRGLEALRRIDCVPPNSDVAVSLRHLHDELLGAWTLASGIAFDALAPRELVAIGDTIPIARTLYNRGGAPVRLRTSEGREVEVLPDSAWTDTLRMTFPAANRAAWLDLMQPRWLTLPRDGDMFAVPLGPEPASATPDAALARVGILVNGAAEILTTPVVYRFADPIRGEVRRPLAVAPAVTLMLDRALQLAPAGTPLDRTVRVQLRAADTEPREVRVSLRLPAGLRADSASRSMTLRGHGATATLEFRLTGTLTPGRHEVAAVAESDGERFTSGYTLIDYPHIQPRRIYRDAVLAIEAVDVRIPDGLRVAYIPGVSDNVAPALADLGVPVTTVAPDEIAGTDLSRFTTVVVGPRAYEASDALVAANDRLLAFARQGGTLLVQYGQYEMTRPGIMPHPVTIARPHDRVTVEESPVRLLSEHPVLSAPNRITLADFDGWVQERSLYMPRTFDDAYQPLVAVREPGDEERTGALLIAPLGEGTYVYTTLAFFRQLPAGVPGAARLFINLLGAGAGANGGSQ